jgi:hypothetical protein
MRQTYKDACRVLVWLGISSSPERRNATRRAAEFLVNRFPLIPDGLTLLEDEDDQENLLRPENAAVLRTICQDLLRRPWWWRIWVIQEVALARSIIVICDGYPFSWEHLVQVTQTIRGIDIDRLKPEADGSEDQNPYLPNINFKAQYRHKLVFGGDLELPILSVLQNASSCLATDPRDMIYGLLGMAADIKTSETPNDENRLVVDYKRQSVADVYVDFATIHMLTHDKNPLDVITFSRFNPTPQYPLPSWVPDWSNLRETSCFSLANPTVPSAVRAMFINHYYYHASGTRHADFTITPSLGLQVAGIRFDSVSRMGEPSLGFPQRLTAVIRGWQTLALGDGSHDEDAYLGGDQRLVDVFDRTVTVDTTLDGRRLTREGGYLFACTALAARRPLDMPVMPNMSVVLIAEAALLLQSFGLEEPDEEMMSLGLAVKQARRAIEVRAHRRRFFVTSRGFFGLGPRNMEEGDAVFVLYGCSVPVVLRPKGEHWSLVGEAFVAGIMDGEVVQATENPNCVMAEGGVPVSLLRGSEEKIEIR